MVSQKDIDEYKQEMIKWIVNNTKFTINEVELKFAEEKEIIDSLFKPYPETVIHQEPEKWAELLAVRFGYLEEIELEFIDEETENVFNCGVTYDFWNNKEDSVYDEINDKKK